MKVEKKPSLSFLNWGITAIIVFSISFSIVLSSCEKTGVMPQFSSLKISIHHVIDAEDLELFPIQYMNESGNTYSITDMKYYVSSIKLTKQNGDIYFDQQIHYIDIKKTNSLSFVLDSIEPGKYIKIEFDLGIDSVRNQTGFLLNTVDNLNMAWPVSMEGGYHFLKFEGKYNINSVPYGFAFHLGKSKAIIHYEINLNKGLYYWNEELILKHDLNEWFKTPSNYNLEVDEPYIMNSDSLINVIRQNGFDAFSL